MDKIIDFFKGFGHILVKGRTRDKVIGWIIVAVALFFLGNWIFGMVSPDTPKTIKASELIVQLENGNVEEMHISNIDGTVEGKFKEPNEEGITSFASSVPERSETFTEKYLQTTGVDYDFRKPSAIMAFLENLLLIVIQVGLIVVAMAWLLSMSGAGLMEGLPFGNSAIELKSEIPDASFDDIAGLPEAIEEVSEIVTFLKDGGKYQQAGADFPKGVLMSGPPGCGKAIPLYWKVLTDSGWKQMGDLTLEDKVYTKDGVLTEIEGIYPQEGELDIWEVELADKRVIECCENHQWPVKADDGSYAGYSTRELSEAGLSTETGKLKYSIPIAQAIEFGEGTYAVSPYAMGTLLGTVSNCGERCTDVSSCDSLISEKLPELLGADELCEVNAKYKTVLHDGGYIPEEYLEGSITQRNKLLQGLMDSSGTISEDRAIFHAATMKLAHDVANLARSLGIPTVIADDGDGKPQTVLMEVSPDGAAQSPAAQDVEIVDIRKTDRKTAMQCISVKDPSHTYIIDEYVVTHNTLLARCLAGEAGVPFLQVSGSDFVEMYVGVGAKRVRAIFEKAREIQPSILFIDEIDAIGGSRDESQGTHDERLQTLNQLLKEMDGFEKDSQVIVIAATNRAQALDRALVRPGRFDRTITVDTPAKEGRIQILKHYAKGRPFAEKVDFDKLAAHTYGFSGAELANAMNQAATLAARRAIEEGGDPMITKADLDEGISRTIAGPAMKSKQMNDEEKRQVAYHEAGHALVQYLLPDCDEVQKISIVSRHMPDVGMAMGYVQSYSEDDSYITTSKEMTSEIAALLAGRCSEKMFCDIESAGAYDDLMKASRMAYEMVDTCAFNIENADNPPLRVAVRDKGTGLIKASEKRLEYVDSQVDIILNRGYATARRLLGANRRKVETIVTVLLEEEVIDADGIRAIMEDKEETV